ncbi:MAG: hypothetical protein QM710_09140 [Flavobacterium sp.]
MSTKSQNNDNQEIDLSQISKKVNELFEGFLTRIFKGILFFKRNIVWVALLFILGVGLGFYLDRTTKIYDNEIIVSPNFGSVDNTYAKIQLIDSKIENADTLFLKNVIGIKKPKKVKSITISPIVDVYKFIENKPENFELIKVMAEDGDIKKVVNENITSKNYPFHMISFVTTGQASDKEIVEPLLDYLNDSDYYQKIQKQYLENIKIKIVQNDSIISQINGLLNAFNSSANGPSKSDKLVYYNENSQLNDVIKTKDQLVAEQGRLKIDLVVLDKIVKDSSTTLNIRNNDSTNGKMKLVLPFLFLFLFIVVGAFKSYYKSQMAKIKK